MSAPDGQAPHSPPDQEATSTKRTCIREELTAVADSGAVDYARLAAVRAVRLVQLLNYSLSLPINTGISDVLTADSPNGLDAWFNKQLAKRRANTD
jgi:hypothetical protein